MENQQKWFSVSVPVLMALLVILAGVFVISSLDQPEEMGLTGTGMTNFTRITVDEGLILPVETLTEATTLDTDYCGKRFVLSATTEFTTTLPAVSNSEGCTLEFWIGAAPSGSTYGIITGNSLENVLIGGVNENEVDTGNDGPYQAAGDTISFADGTAVVGDFIIMFSDGSNWYFRGQANADGGIVVSQAD